MKKEIFKYYEMKIKIYLYIRTLLFLFYIIET